MRQAPIEKKMGQIKRTFSILQDTFALCKLEKDARAIPDWALGGSFVSMTRTAEGFSIVCPQLNLPKGIKAEVGWRCLKLEGPLGFSESGIIASFASPLGQADISIFVISTFDTDYLMIRERDFEKAVSVLSQEGHSIKQPIAQNIEGQ